jgi:hypothetical protein
VWVKQSSQTSTPERIVVWVFSVFRRLFYAILYIGPHLYGNCQFTCNGNVALVTRTKRAIPCYKCERGGFYVGVYMQVLSLPRDKALTYSSQRGISFFEMRKQYFSGRRITGVWVKRQRQAARTLRSLLLPAS